VGALLGCVWFGAYLAFALSIGCHNNEAGSAARIDRFCHFIRIKLERDRITCYVIGFEELANANEPLQPKLIDEFHLGEARSGP
jgi:hypothetical protein